MTLSSEQRSAVNQLQETFASLEKQASERLAAIHKIAEVATKSESRSFDVQLKLYDFFSQSPEARPVRSFQIAFNAADRERLDALLDRWEQEPSVECAFIFEQKVSEVPAIERLVGRWGNREFLRMVPAQDFEQGSLEPFQFALFGQLDLATTFIKDARETENSVLGFAETSPPVFPLPLEPAAPVEPPDVAPAPEPGSTLTTHSSLGSRPGGPFFVGGTDAPPSADEIHRAPISRDSLIATLLESLHKTLRAFFLTPDSRAASCPRFNSPSAHDLLTGKLHAILEPTGRRSFDGLAKASCLAQEALDFHRSNRWDPLDGPNWAKFLGEFMKQEIDRQEIVDKVDAVKQGGVH